MKFDPIKRFTDGEDVNGYLYKYLNKLIDSLNSGLSRLTLDDNIDGQVISDIIIASGEELEIAHKLQIKPRFKLILKQTGNGLVTDGATIWDDKKIYLKNNGAVSVTITVQVMR